MSAAGHIANFRTPSVSSARDLPRREWSFAFSLTCLFLLYAGFATYHHEMWLDELQSWLICRDTSSVFDIFRNSRYEGHPCLWWLCVWPLTRLTGNPAVIQWLNLSIAAGAVFLIAKAAPAPRWLRALAVLGYFPVYEYGTIARNYSLGLFLLIAFCALFPQRRERPVLLGVILLLAANTSLPACLLALAAVFALSVEAVSRPPESSRRRAVWTGLAVAAGGIVISVIQMDRPADIGKHAEWFITPNLYWAYVTMKAVASGYVPVPKPGYAFWGSNIYWLLPLSARLAWVPVATVTFIGTTSLALIRRPVALAYYLVGSFGLLVFFYAKYQSQLRHHGFLFVCFGTALWLACTMRPVTLPRLFDVAGRWGERAVGVLCTLLLAANVIGGGIAVVGEYRYVFSAARATANLIQEKGVDRLTLVADGDEHMAAVVGYLRTNQAFYAAGQRFGSYIIWDEAREQVSDVWDDADRLTRDRQSAVVIIMGFREWYYREKPPPSALLARLQFLGSAKSDIWPIESYAVLLLQPDAVLP